MSQILDLGRRVTFTYRSGQKRTFRYVKVFVIDYQTGPEPAWTPCRRDGRDLYSYPMEPCWLTESAFEQMYAMVNLSNPWSVDTRLA